MQQSHALDADQAFAFVRSLAEELSRGPVEVPAFPDVVLRIRDALADDDTTIEQLVRIVGAEPALAARLLTLANSAFMNPARNPIRDLRAAVARIGQNHLRSAAMAFAVAQMKQAARLEAVRRELAEVWRESTLVAALAGCLARRGGKVGADEAMLAGLLHAVGKLYILGRADQHPQLLADAASLAQAQREWHANIGKAILYNWGFADELAEAVGGYEDLTPRTGPADLTDVLQAAIALAGCADDPAAVEAAVQSTRAFGRLGLDAAGSAAALAESAAEIQELRQALGS